MLHNEEKTMYERPNKDAIIEKDEIIGLRIDLEVMEPDEVFEKYFMLTAQR